MSKPKTVGEGIDALCEVCERYVRCAKDEGGRGMFTWMMACANLMRQMMTALAAVWPDGPLQVIEGTRYAVPKERMAAAARALWIHDHPKPVSTSPKENYIADATGFQRAYDHYMKETVAILQAALGGEVLSVAAVGVFTTDDGEPQIQDGDGTEIALVGYGDRIAIIADDEEDA